MRSEPITLNPAGRAALKAFRDSKPWKGTVDQRADKFAELHRGLIAAYELETLLVRDDQTVDPNGSSGASMFDSLENRIVLRGRLSVVTYLYCFACAYLLCQSTVSRNDATAVAIEWAQAQFRHFFPRSARGCREDNGLLVRDEPRDESN